MVVGRNPEAHRREFDALLNSTVDALRKEGVRNPAAMTKLNGILLEETVADVMRQKARSTPFENKIEVISGQRFPDIVAKDYYGVEVKTTTGKHWTSTGSSIMEGTRVPTVERIFLLFAKLGTPIDFRCKPYEECLSEVVVTHSPRYLINMDLPEGETIFDKLGVPYDELRAMDNPVASIVDYYRKKLKPGEKLWWLDNSTEPQASSLIIKFWNTLDKIEKARYTAIGYAYYPELVSGHYNRFSLYLAGEQSIICPNVRDLYSAGGQGTITYNGKIYPGISKSIVRLLSHIPQIHSLLKNVSSDELSKRWEITVPKSERGRIQHWIKQIANEVQPKVGRLPFAELLASEFGV